MPPAVRTVAGAVLAAGSGTRMGRPKAELVVGGVRLLDRATGVLRDAGCGPVIAVVREGTQLSVDGAQAVVNPDPDRGMRSSLGLAVDALGDDALGEIDALAVLLVDTPGVVAQAVRDVVSAWRPGRIAVARYGSRRGHPIVMAPGDWRASLEFAGPDEGARAYLAARRDVLDEVDVAGTQTDLDTPEDLARWTGR